MRRCHLSQLVCSFLVVIATTAIASQAQTLTPLHNFAGRPNDGADPYAALVQNSDGNFYGTTESGGADNRGTVFKMTPSGGVTILHSFTGSGSDGSEPTAGLVRGSDGNFYGTTQFGGSNGNGTVFKITPNGTLTTLHSFDPGQGDGGEPYAGLIQASGGNFYGTTTAGGTHFGNGTIFRITPSGAVTILYSFACTGGCHPNGGVVQGSDGNFYGTTRDGGTNGFNYGVVFKITVNGSFTLLHTFEGSDGGDPYASMIQGSDGNFYGTTSLAGAHGGGTVFKITPSGTLTTVYSFCPGGYPCADGQSSYAPLMRGNDGNFYGTTYLGGANNVGTVFQLTPAGGLTTMHSFNGGDGAAPYAGLLQLTNGDFYGTTSTGGSGDGTIFQMTPPPIPTATVLTSTPNPSSLGQNVTMTATVTAANGSTPTGNVVFQSDGAQIGTVSLTNGTAVLNYSSLSLGTHSLVATYQGNSSYAGSTSNTVQQVVELPATMTTVSSAPNPSTVGQSVTITATVGPSGPPQPTGTVSFTSNGTAISGCTDVPLSNSLTAVCTTSTLPTGTDMAVASYSGDGNYMPSQGTVVQIVNPVPTAVKFVTLPPCRIVDTRNANGTFGGPPIQGHTSRSFPLAQSGNPCGIPSNAIAYSLNVTVVTTGHLGYLTIWPTGEGQPIASTMNSPDGRTKANAAIIPAGTPDGSVSVYVTDTTNVILDINGYFTQSGGRELAFYPVSPCRVVDTRGPDGNLGGPYLQGQRERDFPVLESSCGLPSSAAAYSMNFTVLPRGSHLGYLTVWPVGQQQPQVSTLNDPTGTNVANAALVSAGTNGAIATYVTDDTDLLIDVDGYFAPPGSGGLSFYSLTPCRVLDTRNGGGQPFQGELTVNVQNSPCGPPATAQGYVFNATVIPSGPLYYLTLWPDGQQQPTVSTLNAKDGAITSNMAVVPNANGKADAWAQGSTQLILDISGYFAP